MHMYFPMNGWHLSVWESLLKCCKPGIDMMIALKSKSLLQTKAEAAAGKDGISSSMIDISGDFAIEGQLPALRIRRAVLLCRRESIDLYVD